jgi:hypothetical protein
MDLFYITRLQPQQITITGTLGAIVQVSSAAYVLGAPSDLAGPFWSDLFCSVLLESVASYN